MVVQKERDNQVLALSETWLRFQPEYDDFPETRQGEENQMCLGLFDEQN